MVGAFPLDRELPASSLHLTEWSTKESMDVLETFSSKVFNTTILVLKSSTHSKEAAATCPKEDVLSRNKEVLERIKIYDAIFASLFTYDVNEDVLRVFCELWHSSTNTICSGIGELSISLWDMRMIGGLPVQGSFYDEVVPSAQELTQANQHGKPFFPKTCAYLFSAFYQLAGVHLRRFPNVIGIDDVLVIEPYSPHRFSGQFGFSQDLPGDLIERTYDGTLQELVQLWNSCTRFSSSSTVIISPRPAWPLMTRRYTDWWSAVRASLVGHTKIIFKCSKRNDTHAPSKVRHPQPKDRIKPSSSFVKSKTSQLSFKSSTSKGVLIGPKPLSSTSKLSSTPSMVSDNTCKRKDPPTSSENNTGNMSTEVLCNDETLIPLSVDEALVIDGATSSTEGDGDHPWNRKKKKVKDLGDRSSEFNDLDTVSFDSDIFLDGDPNSMMLEICL
ncbi:hypothetical protein RND71_022120 [Anisodus tanguticus]|uniref:Aminotransferase-like plant mobile domain-containing protein n=1 Tax=Anisodus tanguticus TaxID=243964 RepID=A0AAE1VDN0_9SOLA|nr:hypothetical protein RND71_022120 [Anisodus tanguticus]